jgi:hypothetical protein
MPIERVAQPSQVFLSQPAVEAVHAPARQPPISCICESCI